ncbi:MAG: ABC-ATPase domain-containing protein [Eubacteriales bacterium]|nr:ABC-ATPase domain-containing protein [Eubacteriales bacterium]
MKKASELEYLLKSIDHKGYPAYKSLAGRYDFMNYVLSIDHVQGDPFASPSRLSIYVNRRKAGFPEGYLDTPGKRCALADYVLRAFGRAISRFSFQAGGSGKSGLIGISRPGQEVLVRSACEFTDSDLIVRFEVGFPAAGRTVLAGELQKILFDYLPKCVSSALFYRALPAKDVENAVFLKEDQEFIRKSLSALGLVGFVADGSVLPRESGVSDRPMAKAIPFSSPDSLAVTLNLPHRGPVRGMGIQKGITLIAGGGYHGKSTLLKALERGVYDHIAGDGREYVITDGTAVKLRAEDGRKITSVDISLFINDLPNGADTRRFSTLDASGSTSQAAAIVEGMEAGSRLFLIDEDTSATNFMVRDALMQQVVSKNKEPITPFLERARDLYEKAGISTILVIGSCGSYFYIADTVLQMDSYHALDITDQVADILKRRGLETFHADGFALPASDRRLPLTAKAAGNTAASAAFAGRSAHGRGRGDYGKGRPDASRQGAHEHAKVKTLGKTAFSIDKENVDLRYVEQLVDSEQTTALSYLLRYAKEHYAGSNLTLVQLVNELTKILEKQGLSAICDSSYVPVNLAMPRAQEIFACFNRY